MRLAVATVLLLAAGSAGAKKDPALAAVRASVAALPKVVRLRVDALQSPQGDLASGTRVSPDAVTQTPGRPVAFHALQRVQVTRVQPVDGGGWLLMVRPADYAPHFEEDQRQYMEDDAGRTDAWAHSSAPAMERDRDGWIYSAHAQDMTPLTYVAVDAADRAGFDASLARLFWLDGTPSDEEVARCLAEQDAAHHPAIASRRCGTDGPGAGPKH